MHDLMILVPPLAGVGSGSHLRRLLVVVYLSRFAINVKGWHHKLLLVFVQRKGERFLVEYYLLLKPVVFIPQPSNLIICLFQGDGELAVLINQSLFIFFDMFQLPPGLVFPGFESASLFFLLSEVAVLLEEFKLTDEVADPVLQVHVFLFHLDEANLYFASHYPKLLHTVVPVKHRGQRVVVRSNEGLEFCS